MDPKPEMSALTKRNENLLEQLASAPRWQITLSIGFALAVLASGCGIAPPKPWEKVYPAKGVLNYKGKPLGGAMITLIPQNSEFPDSVRPSATTKDDGTFELGTYSRSDGAPAGAYKALVLHFPVVGPKDNPSPGRNDLPAKYARPESTDLTVEVSESSTELKPLELD
jgi:hypothetical protein